MPEPELRHVKITLCEACLSGEGGECHTPGCAMWLNRAPDIPLHDKVESANDVNYEQLNAEAKFLYDSALALGIQRGETRERVHVANYHARGLLEVAGIALAASLANVDMLMEDQRRVAIIARRLLAMTPQVSEGVSAALIQLRDANLNDPRLPVKREKLEVAHRICVAALEELGGRL